MVEWFTSLSGSEQLLWGVALISTIIFLFILVTTFIAGDSDIHGADMDVDTSVETDFGAGFQFFTFKNLVAFFTIFGWAGIACLDAGLSLNLSLIIAVICGLLMMFLMSLLFYYMNKMTQSGTLEYKNAINAIGEVYLEIGKNRSKMGKVMIRVQGALREMEALTDHNENLKQSTIIKVASVTDNGILIVTPTN